MKSVIEEIYYGNIEEKYKTSEEYGKICGECDKLYKEIEKHLNEEQREILWNFSLKNASLEGEAACAHFKEGFKMGLLVAIEALT